MGNFILILICLIAGVILRRLPAFPKNAHEGLNAFIFYISLPALAFRYIPTLDYRWEILYPALMPWLVFIFCIPLFELLGRAFNWDRRTVGCLVLTCGLGNTSFVGFPLLEFFYGAEGLRYGLIADQAGSFLVVSSLGIAAAVYYDTGKPKAKDMLKKLISFPPFPAFIIALLLTFVRVPDELNLVFEKLGATLSPLALFSVGLQLNWQQSAFRILPLSLGLGYKLFLAPLLIYGLYAGVFRAEGMIIDVSVVEAAMAPMITGVLLASQYNLKPVLASMFAAIGIPLSLLTVWLWYLFL
ncbi:MAG: AEC family transporter [Bernardetiaceae bacterium]|nr:AEC family transporter [Bernardetiaceae bacterium]